MTKYAYLVGTNIYKLSPSIHLGGLFYLHSYWNRLLQFDSALCTNFKFNKNEKSYGKTRSLFRIYDLMGYILL